MIVWRLRWALALRRRRLLAWNLLVPLALLVPVAVGPAAAPHRAAVFAVFFVFFGAFGACVPLVRDASSGWLDTLLGTGISARRWLAERALAEAALDAIQLAPPALVLLAVAGGGPRAGLALGGAACVALLAANTLGLLVAALVRSLAEGALVCAAAALVALHATGVFRSPRDGAAAVLAAWSPFRPLHEALGRLAGGGAPVDGLAWTLPLVSLALLAGGALLLAPAASRRLRWPHATAD